MSDSTPDNAPAAPARADAPAAASTPLPPQPLGSATQDATAGAAPTAPATSAPAHPAPARPLLRRTWVTITGAAVAAVLLLGGGFGAGWAAAGARVPGGPAGWSQDRGLPGLPGDDSGRPSGPGGGFQNGGPGGDHDHDGDSPDESGSDSGTGSDSDSGSGSGTGSDGS